MKGKDAVSRYAELEVGEGDTDNINSTQKAMFENSRQGVGLHHLTLWRGLDDRLPGICGARHDKAEAEVPLCTATVKKNRNNSSRKKKIM